MNQENVYNITAYNLYDFLCEIQNGVKQGYVLSDKNSHFPQGFVSLYTCTLVKEDIIESLDSVISLVEELNDIIDNNTEFMEQNEVEIATTVAENTTEVTEPVKEVTLKDESAVRENQTNLVVTNAQVKNTAGRKAKVQK